MSTYVIIYWILSGIFGFLLGELKPLKAIPLIVMAHTFYILGTLTAQS